MGTLVSGLEGSVIRIQPDDGAALVKFGGFTTCRIEEPDFDNLAKSQPPQKRNKLVQDTKFSQQVSTKTMSGFVVGQRVFANWTDVKGKGDGNGYWGQVKRFCANGN